MECTQYGLRYVGVLALVVDRYGGFGGGHMVWVGGGGRGRRYAEVASLSQNIFIDAIFVYGPKTMCSSILQVSW